MSSIAFDIGSWKWSPIFLQFSKLKPLRQIIERYWLANRLKRSNQELSRILLDIEAAIGVANDRKVAARTLLAPVVTYMCSDA